MSPLIKRLNSDILSDDEGRRTTALREIMELAYDNAGELSSLPPLLVVLEGGSDECRQMASWSLGKLAQSGIGDMSELEYLVTALSDEDAEVRENGAWALGELAGDQIGAGEELPVLTALLTDETATVRGMAAWALGRLAQRMGLVDEGSIAPLETLVADKSLYVSKGAEYALRRLKERVR
jgi:HEAT repeat protein